MAESIPAGYSPRLYNEDLAPAEHRKWGFYSLFAMWMSDIHSLGGYTFAAGLFAIGLGAWQVFLALVVGIVLVFFLMNLSGYAGQKTGVPYPVLARISFGTIGANLPALIRALVAIAWYGIQTWLASRAVIIIALKIWPDAKGLTENDFLGESTLGWLGFLLMWALQLVLLRNGMDTIRRFQDWAGPAVWVVMGLLVVYILLKAGWRVSLELQGGTATWGVGHAFVAAIALTVTYFSTLLLNFCDFSRFAPDRRAVWTANLWGLPVNFIAFSVVSVVVTAGTYQVYGKHIYDPVEIVGRIDSVWALLLGAVTFAVATLGINVVANFVSPAYDLANVWPEKITFKRGGLIAALIALVITPWNLFNSPVVVNLFLGGLGALLGPLFGIIMVDYYVLRRQHVAVCDLFRERGHYTYRSGWNPKAVASFVVSAVPAVVVALVPAFDYLAPFSWFIGGAIAAVVHWAISRHDTSIAEAVAAAAAAEPAAGTSPEARI
ncbi:NCS1 family nucleobase:cation symporter-1 [Sinomonas atrocyanea]|uniref:NCS1 family nucleobase:cation symporter-1 n=1 Tax=Sinomonas atrocyanea TaxID=37927 RepID=UPI0027899167|nr:NCS1 family nucleobase:cation symporter-1 [Sinomonas atrocyanea]MDQ0261886.1 NCS1 family nucleobase:cation symporter-1 [Sinomonas atrocyanea]MDR6623302.1 NCS1 family nucleobase:cation symporter-1 [Sinomonas atrocyanea]